PTFLRKLPKHFLPGLDHLAFSFRARFLVVLPLFQLREDAGLFALPLEAPHGVFEGFVFLDVDQRHEPSPPSPPAPKRAQHSSSHLEPEPRPHRALPGQDRPVADGLSPEIASDYDGHTRYNEAPMTDAENRWKAL